MKILDLTHLMKAGMPVYPGTEEPSFSDAFSLSEHGFRESRLTMLTHTGTHMDAPAHILAGAPTLDVLPVTSFIGDAVVIDVSRSGGIVSVDDLCSSLAGIAEGDFVLLRTDWDGRWGDSSYFSGYPTLSPEAAHWLADHDIKGLGLDCISADPADTTDFEIHKILLGSGMVIIENLRGLAGLPEGPFRFAAFPLNLQDGDGSPIRAVGMWD